MYRIFRVTNKANNGLWILAKTPEDAVLVMKKLGRVRNVKNARVKDVTEAETKNRGPIPRSVARIWGPAQLTWVLPFEAKDLEGLSSWQRQMVETQGGYWRLRYVPLTEN